MVPLRIGQVVTVRLDGQARTAFVATYRADAAGQPVVVTVLIDDKLVPLDPAWCIWGEVEQQGGSMGRDWDNQGVLPGLLPEQPRLFNLPAAAPRPSAAARYAQWVGDRDGTIGAVCMELQGPAAALSVEEMGRRWAKALRRRYAKDAAKRIQGDFARLKLEVPDERTVWSWINGQLPRLYPLAVMVLVHGPAIAGEVLAPGSRWGLTERVAEELRGVQARLSELGVA